MFYEFNKNVIFGNFGILSECRCYTDSSSYIDGYLVKLDFIHSDNATIFIDNSICNNINNDKKKYFVLHCLHKKLNSPQHIIDQIQSLCNSFLINQDYILPDINNSDLYMKIVSKQESNEYSKYCLSLILSLYIYYKILETYLSSIDLYLQLYSLDL